MTRLNTLFAARPGFAAGHMLGAAACLLGCALPGLAQAQSSVTIFGTMDLNLTFSKAGGQSNTAMDQGGSLQPSRIGFRGVEDIGKGLKAGFWLETAVLPDTGAQQGVLFHRRATLSLESNTAGELRLGRDYVPTFWNLSKFSPLGTSGVGGAANIVDSYPFGLGGARNLVRANNSVGYFLPKDLGGLYGQAMYAAAEGADGTRYTGLRLGYASGPFDIAAAYGQTPTAGQTLKVSTVGASYAFSGWSLMGYVFQQNTGTDKQVNALIGAIIQAGNGSIRTSFAKSRRSGAGVDGDDAHQLAVGYIYPLSKRTALYGTYSHISNKGNAAYITADSSPAATPGGKASGLQFGFLHNF
ncbi:MAG: porin [Pseudomonadota bacterium]